MTDSFFPQTRPNITVTNSGLPPFALTIEEIPGFFIIPRVGEKARFAFYDDPDGALTGVYAQKCVGSAEIHGIPCVRVESEDRDGDETSQRTVFLRLTDTHCSYIAEMSVRGGTLYFGSFLDDEWLERYQVGEGNCGREIRQRQKGVITIDQVGGFTAKAEEAVDVLGRYEVTVGARVFDTVALASIEEGIFVIQYIGANGRTALFRRYNKDDWNFARYGKRWSEKLPGSETFLINGQKYVHWYDCVPDTSF